MLYGAVASKPPKVAHKTAPSFAINSYLLCSKEGRFADLVPRFVAQLACGSHLCSFWAHNSVKQPSKLDGVLSCHKPHVAYEAVSASPITAGLFTGRNQMVRIAYSNFHNY